MQEMSCSSVGRRIQAMKREQNLEIRRRDEGEIEGGDQESGLDLAFRRLIEKSGAAAS